MAEESGRPKRLSPDAVDPGEFRQLLEEMVEATTAIEKLVNRTNTLVHLLDTLNKRVDRLEARDGP